MPKRKVLNLDSQDTNPEVVEEEIPKKEDAKEQKGLLKDFSSSSQIGFVISLPIAGGALLGSYLDSKFKSEPSLTLLLLLLGLVIAGINIYRLIKDFERKDL